MSVWRYAAPLLALTLVELVFPPYVARLPAGAVRLGRDLLGHMQTHVFPVPVSIDWGTWALQWVLSCMAVAIGILAGELIYSLRDPDV